jgi:antitoxin component YwqK of YwqJK toxin-antitoxin module
MERVLNDSLVYDEGTMLHGGVPFTGIGYTLDANGAVNSEIEYRNGLEWGLSRTWYLPGKLFQESTLFMGTRHGTKREWYPNGQLKEEGDYELGFAVRKKTWDEAGNLLESYELKETDPKYRRLQHFREIYRDDLAAENPEGSEPR